MNNPNQANDKRLVKLENVLSKDYLPFLSGRPNREKEISNDDLLNLRIALNSNVTLEEFLTKV